MRRSPYKLDPGQLADLLSQRDYHVHRGLEEATHRNYDTICRNYVDLCESIERPPWPVNYESISLFFTHYCISLGHKVTSTYNLSTALKNFSIANGYAWLNERDLIRIKRLRRGLGKFQRPTPARKCPMTLERLAELLQVTDLSSLQDLQNMTIAWLGHDALLRFSEIRNIKHRNIQWKSESLATITLEVTKTSHDAPQEQVNMEAYTMLGEKLSGTHLLRIYLERLRAAGLPTGPDDWVFPKLATKSRSVQISKPSFIAWLRQALTRAGHDPSKFSGHSFRAGGATDLYASGAPPRLIQLQGRWKSDAYIIYIRDHPDVIAKDVSLAFQAVISFGWNIGRF